MSYRVPFLQVIGPNDEDMLRTWGSKLIGVKLVDRADGESDEATFRFTRKAPYMPIPGEGTPYTVRVGWAKDNVVIAGIYSFQRTHIFGAPKRGQELHLICRAADLTDHLKQVDSEHFDKDTGHKTMGDVFQSLFRSGGKTVEVHPDIAKIPLPGDYQLRWNQSRMDFAADLALDFGGTLKFAGDKVLILKDGSGDSASGKPLPTINLRFDENYEFDVELEPRFSYQKVSASYLDTDKGTLEREEKSRGSGKGGDALPHPFASKEAAAMAAAAEAQKWAASAGTGMFTSHGLPEAVAGAPTKCSGYGTPIDGMDWLSTVVTHDVIPDVGWNTTVETEVKSD